MHLVHHKECRAPLCTALHHASHRDPTDIRDCDVTLTVKKGTTHTHRIQTRIRWLVYRTDALDLDSSELGIETLSSWEIDPYVDQRLLSVYVY